MGAAPYGEYFPPVGGGERVCSGTCVFLTTCGSVAEWSDLQQATVKVLTDFHRGKLTFSGLLGRGLGRDGA